MLRCNNVLVVIHFLNFCWMVRMIMMISPNSRARKGGKERGGGRCRGMKVFHGKRRIVLTTGNGAT